MKKILILLLAIVMVSCDNGLVVTIPASSSFDFQVLASQVNSDPDNLYSATETIDPGNFATEQEEAIESIGLDKLTYEISEYNNASGNIVLVDLTFQTRAEGSSSTTDVLIISGLVVENTGEVLAYEEGNPSSALSAAQVASLEATMSSLEPFDLIVTVDFTDDVDSNFKISTSWDLSIAVSQDSGD